MTGTTIAALAGAAAIVAVFAAAPAFGLDAVDLGERVFRGLTAAALLAWTAWLLDARLRRDRWQWRLGRDLRAKGRGYAATGTAVLVVAALFLVGAGSALLVACAAGAAMLVSAQLLPH